MTKHSKYAFPSSFVNEIEQPLRRDVVASMNRRSKVYAWLFRLVILVALGFLVAFAVRMTDVTSGEVSKPIVLLHGQRADMGVLCAQYRSDKLMSGEPMSSEMKAECGF